MRLIIRLCLPFGNYATHVIETANEFSWTNLKQKISDKFKLSKTNFFLKFNKDGFIVIIEMHVFFIFEKGESL